MGTGFIRKLAGGLAALIVTAVAMLTVIIPVHALAANIDFPPNAEFEIHNQASQVIGHTGYTVTPDGPNVMLVKGENRFFDGQFDIENSRVEDREGDQLPVMISSQHLFYSASKVLQQGSQADFRAGSATCYERADGGVTPVTAKLDFPPDTYAGAAVVIPMRHYLREGRRSEIKLHAFNCIPGPKVMAIMASANPPAAWGKYPGELVQMTVKPDFGWLNVLVAPFVPEIRPWFNPSADWDFVGGDFSRYYKGPQVVLVRVANQDHGTRR
jgi:hypothetical protein